ncbi:MAG TPA: hypothetical protein VEI52_08810 [Terriglobales bacterium]|nr:hypothetical protein [Terriglobales bacterium]
MATGFFAVADPQVSFDGARVLFSGLRESKGRWQIWEMQADGTNKRQITRCAQDCVRPAYLSGEEIVFTAVESRLARPVSYLVVAARDGSQPHRITFGPADFQLETVLRDGRIVASAPWPLLAGSETPGGRQLYTLRPDGTALESLRCDHHESTVEAAAEELDDGSIVFLLNPAPADAMGGHLFAISRGALRASALGPGNTIFWSARRLTADELLVARQRSANQGTPSRFDLFVFDLAANTIGAPVYSDPRSSSVQAVPLTPRPVPKRFWTTVSPQATEGDFVSLNSYLSADEPQGRISTPIAHVRVHILDPRKSLDHELGDASVEQDGSFYVAVPPDQPVRFELLDTNGKTIRSERSWIWARPGEQRGCAGCHADKALSPANHWPLTFKRSDTPTHLGNTARASTPGPGNAQP